MFFTKGMIKDLAPDMLPEGAWVDAQNIVIDSPGNTISNEKGTELWGAAQAGFYINGIIPLNEGFIRFLVNSMGVSRIDRVDNIGTASVIVNDAVFNFDIERPIEGVFTRNYKNEIIIVWWEGVADDANPPRILNIDNLPFAVNVDYSLVNSTDIELTTLMSNVQPPKISLNAVYDTGGALRSGAYSTFIFYEDEDGTRTGYTVLGNIVPIYKDRIDIEYVGGFLKLQGDDGDILTSKSFSIALTNIDTKYTKIGIGVIRKSAGIVSAFIDNVYDISGTTGNFTITGSSVNIEDVDLTTILTPTIIYTKAQAGAVYDNQLYLYNLRTEDTIADQFQEIANDVVVTFYERDEDKISVDYEYTDNSYKLPSVVYSRRSLMYDEVYALYMGITTKTGKSIHHIPGRIAQAVTLRHFSSEGHADANPDTDIVTTDDALLSDIIAANPGLNTFNLEQAVLVDPSAQVFHFFDTAAPGGGAYEIVPGYWENADEVYPTNFPDFAGENVRHHRTPSWEHMNRNYDERNFGGSGGSKALLPLGIKFSNIIIPSELQDTVIAIEFFYAARGETNSLHVATNMLDTRAIDTDVDLFNNMRDFDLLYRKPVLSISYLKTHHYYLGDIEPSLPGGDTTTVLSCLKDNNFEPYRAIRKVTNAQYVIANTAVDIDNTDKESIVYFDIESLIEDTTGYSANPLYVLMASLMRHQRNMYVNYHKQELVNTGGLIYANETECVVYGGDTFINPQSVRVNYPLPTLNNIYKIPVLSLSNLWLRQEGLQDWERFFPYSDIQDFTLPSGTEYNDYDDYRKYNYDYSSVQNFVPYDSYLNNGEPLSLTGFTDRYPFRIARAAVQSNESSIQSWRTFLANDYHEMPANKGEGWVLRVMNRTLMIQSIYSLFAATARDRLLATNIDVALGRGDLFNTDPDEIISEDGGYFGCRHKWSAFVCKHGYVAVDDVQGKILLYNGQPREISAEGMMNFFKEHSLIFGDEDNPFQGQGWCAGYDEKANRMLFTRWEGYTDIIISDFFRNSNYTISYSPGNGWLCFNKYMPNCIFHNRQGMFSVRNRVVKSTYKHNSDNYGIYYDEEIHSSWIDYPVTNNPELQKNTVGVSWNTQVENGDVRYLNKTITHLTAYNQYQCTGRITLNYSKQILPSLKNIARINDRWFFNALHDIVIDPSVAIMKDTGILNTANLSSTKRWFEIYRFLQNFIIFRLEYDNVEQNKVIIKSIIAEQQTNL